MTERNLLPFGMAFLANFILCASSIYWHLFVGLSPVALVIYRIAFSLVLLGLLVGWLASRGSDALRRMTGRVVALHVAAAILVAINWGAFIWASLRGSVLESGLGYLLAPVFVMIVGLLFLSESRSSPRLACIAVILLALVTLVTASGDLEHWVYWTIGATWGAYTLLKKRTPLSPIEGLFVETTTLSILLVLASAWVDFGPHAPAASQVLAFPWLAAAGLVSVAPLVMFAFAARTLGAFDMGALQFVLPTTQLLVSYAYYGQVAAVATYVCFGVIWMALVALTLFEGRVFARRSACRRSS
ncbi:EamA family transporter [Salinarimonas chemoclinalis]|uniref:EamA family transporter n=1 Tax=Salinarimonas chemoclinalis TaxID=3241599 RepID=UPI00355933CE